MPHTSGTPRVPPGSNTPLEDEENGSSIKWHHQTHVRLRKALGKVIPKSSFSTLAGTAV